MADEEPTRGDRAATGPAARRFFEDLWADSDPWALETSELDQSRYRRQMGLLEDRGYGRALELGCGAGSFTRHLAPLCGHVVAVDISESAIARARHASPPATNTEFRVANIMELEVEAEGPWDLVVLTETAYYLGWLYPLFDVGWLAYSLCGATNAGGRLLLVNTLGSSNGIMSPWLIRTYRDLFGNAGFQLEVEETLRGTKEGVEFEILLSLFGKDGR